MKNRHISLGTDFGVDDIEGCLNHLTGLGSDAAMMMSMGDNNTTDHINGGCRSYVSECRKFHFHSFNWVSPSEQFHPEQGEFCRNG
jgi:hypothetical protein